MLFAGGIGNCYNINKKMREVQNAKIQRCMARNLRTKNRLPMSTMSTNTHDEAEVDRKRHASDDVSQMQAGFKLPRFGAGRQLLAVQSRGLRGQDFDEAVAT